MSSFVYNVKVNAMQSAINTAIKDTILKLSKKYVFDSEEAFAFLGVEEKLRVNIGAKAKPLRAPKREQPKFPLPFSGEQIENCCIAILPNKGLYSQCLNAPATDGLCSSCFKKASNTPFGKPEYGTIEARIEQGDEYKDPKGKKPTHFTQIMKKMNLTEDFVFGEVTKYNLPFDTNHFLEPEQTKRGRPNKKKQTENTKATRAKKATHTVEVALNDEDLVNLMIQDQEMGNTPAPVYLPPAPTLSETIISAPANPLNLSLEIPEHSSSSQENEENMSELTESPKIVEKATKKQEKAKKEAEKEAKKQEKAKKEAEKEAKKQEKAKKEAEKEAKKQEKEKKEAEEEAKKQEKEKAKKEAEKQEKVESDELSVENIDDEPEPEPEPQKPVTTKVQVKPVTYNGVKYLVKADNTAWRADSSEYAGYWLPEEKIIVFEEDEEEDDDEEEEDDLPADSDED
jgi:hypothetical protein